MPLIREIESLELPELQPYRTLRRPIDHHREGIFVAEGGKVVQRMIDAGIEVVSVLLSPEWLARLRMSGEHSVFVAPQALLESIVGFRLHQGVMAIGRIPAQPSVEEVLRRSERPWLLLALDGLVHAENVGLVARNAAAFGAQALLFDHTTSHPYLRRSVRNSMGAVFKLPVIQAPDLPGILTQLRSAGLEVIGADPNASESLETADLTGDICVVLGNEGEGITDRVRAVCTRRISIPMNNETDSLNVSSAGAVILFEAARQRKL
jgi:tRNA G18 (ribose-2'-O)-methylase SpoU